MEKQPVRIFRDLIVWQKSMQVVTGIYQHTQTFPVTEQYGLTSQLRRCAVSIPANIAEGYGRNSTQDYIRFLRIANGSLFELQTLLEICLNLKLMKTDIYKSLNDQALEIERMLRSLINKLCSK